MRDLICEFFGTEDGEPWCAFVWGQHPVAAIDTTAIRERILREADVFDLGVDTTAEIAEIITAPPAHLWLCRISTVEDAQMYQFCAEGDQGALAITGWKL